MTMQIRIPNPQRQRISDITTIEEINRWSGGIDTVVDGILRALQDIQRAIATVTKTTGTTPEIAHHAPQHLPDGPDALSTAAPTTALGGESANSTGTANAFSRNNHDHDVATDTPAIVLGASASEGGGNALLRNDATIAAFDTTNPAPLGESASPGVIAKAARRDHVHKRDGIAYHMRMFVPTGTILTVPTKHQIICHNEYLVEGTGELALEGTGELLVDDFDEPSRASLLSVLNPVSYIVTSDKFWGFDSPSGSSGTFYFGGFYELGATHDDFNPSITFGTINKAEGAHFFVVVGIDAIDSLTLLISGVSITDEGVLNTTDTETISLAGKVTDDYVETTKKWLSQITIAVSGGTAKNCNYGFVKYWDNYNADFTVKGIEATWLGGANDTGANLRVLHHRPTGWTYVAGSTPIGPPAIAKMGSGGDYGSIYDNVRNGEYGAWKRTGLSTDVSGSTDEGTIIQVVTTANKAFELGTAQMQIQVTQAATLT